MRSVLFAAAMATAAPWGLAQTPRVVITSPAATEPVAGEVTFAARVVSAEPVARVEFRVDGRLVGSATAAPFEVEADVGYENVEHRFEAVAVTAGGATARAAVRTPRIQVDEEVTVKLQQLYVTAAKGSRRALGLDRDDFRVFDDGRRQKLITFERGDIPFTAVILLDASASMAGEKMRAALDGAQAFAQAMRPLDEAKLVAFSDRPLASTPFLTSGDELAGDLLALAATGGTALNDQLYHALHELEQRQGRRVVIMLSDGLDSHSVLAIDDVLPLVGRSRALLYWVRLVSGGPTSPDFDPGREHSAWRDGKAHRRQVDELERAVLRSGGRVEVIRSAPEMRPTFEEILAELREQYVLGYYPDAARNDGSWHEVEVRSRVPSISLRASAGYLDY